MNVKLKLYLNTAMNANRDFSTVNVWRHKIYALQVGKIIFKDDKEYSQKLKHYYDTLYEYMITNEKSINAVWRMQSLLIQPALYLKQWTEILQAVTVDVVWPDAVLYDPIIKTLKKVYDLLLTCRLDTIAQALMDIETQLPNPTANHPRYAIDGATLYLLNTIMFSFSQRPCNIHRQRRNTIA
jgi:hypothetical protein